MSCVYKMCYHIKFFYIILFIITKKKMLTSKNNHRANDLKVLGFLQKSNLLFFASPWGSRIERSLQIDGYPNAQFGC